MISRHVSVDRRDRVAAEAHGAGAGSPWAAEDLVDPARPGVGRYGDAQWVFPSDRASGRPWRIDFGRPGEAFPTADWLVVARDLVMALYGRCPGRSGLARSGSKPVTVMLATRKLGVVARWAHAAGHGLPHEWTRATIGAFVVAYHDSRLPIRVSSLRRVQHTPGVSLRKARHGRRDRQQPARGRAALTRRDWRAGRATGVESQHGPAATNSRAVATAWRVRYRDPGAMPQSPRAGHRGGRADVSRLLRSPTTGRFACCWLAGRLL